ncbi:MAG: bifunctional UDP-N-acetylglucosamine diphosphorylase/glucosamine-1-phosphate N-acetyltransferase GlmU [Turicibacter sp.]|nr:bifunctional UDP-N-acetylglucosamine diphosphorylase/glucosamine-1-phosphate N-acetyltransferase GlmU [Turicibacter sp.]
MSTKAIILAAGKGKRMNSALPKVMHTILGKPMLHHVIESCFNANIRDVTVIVGHDAQSVVDSTKYAVDFVVQHEQLGTGHAVLSAKDSIAPSQQVLILCGDTPLISPKLLELLPKIKGSAQGVVVSTTLENPTGYGRIIVDDNRAFEAIVEERDASSAQRAIREINTGIFLFDGEHLLAGLEKITNNNDQGEYYLTDVPKLMAANGLKLVVHHEPDSAQFLGVNSQRQLADAAEIMRKTVIDRHLDNGVQILDPQSTHIDADVIVESGVIIHPGVILQSKCHIAAGTVLLPYTVADSAVVGKNCQVGPFAYLRGGTVIGDYCRVGDFVEVKNSTLGNNTKASHLAYIGDAELGDDVNFGCGAITVNYDGENKHKTTVEDGAFIGSNVNLVAPVKIGKSAFVAAGSTVTNEVPSKALAIARQRQINKENWK